MKSKQVNHGLAVYTWKDRRTPNFNMGIWGEKCGDLSEIYDIYKANFFIYSFIYPDTSYTL